MSEIKRIVELFDKLQEGECWIGLNMQQALEGVTAEKALKSHQGSNNTWQLVNHLIYWRSRVMNRLHGGDSKPAFPDFFLPGIIDEKAWQQTLVNFHTNYAELRATILAFDESRLHELSPKKDQTYFHVLMGCLQHDGYHMGQMVLLKK